MTLRKKLIEVALPLDAINKASVREKSIRHGHPSTLHLWWARRPLAACRSMLMALLREAERRGRGLPSLRLLLSGGAPILAWPQWAGGLVVGTATGLAPPIRWTPAAQVPVA